MPVETIELPGAKVGTVDKFQGQEAPVVIYSMTTSTPEDAPRGMECLYNRNRFNVSMWLSHALAAMSTTEPPTTNLSRWMSSPSLSTEPLLVTFDLAAAGAGKHRSRTGEEL